MTQTPDAPVTTRAELRRPRARRRVRLGLALSVLPLLIATGAGLILLWPSERVLSPPPLVVQGGSFQNGEVVSVHEVP